MTENGEEKETPTNVPAGAPTKSRKKMAIIIAIGALVVVLGGAGAFLAMGKGNKDSKSTDKETVEILKAEAEGKEVEEDHGKENGKDKKAEAKHGGEDGGAEEAVEEPEDKLLVYKMQPIAANLNETNFKRMVSVTLVVEARDKPALKEVEENDFRITDSVISLLSGKTQADLRSETGKDLLKQEIKVRIDHLLGKGKITFVGFQQFYFF